MTASSDDRHQLVATVSLYILSFPRLALWLGTDKSKISPIISGSLLPL